MTIALKSLPLGFRFHPTDEELVNHYLKPKITGRSTSEVEVVAEIDVCKCEPWDLPDKSIIRSDDPEWFFFAPKDRKYPNGHRSNRATEKGYWKATGTDRIIRSKPSSEKSIIIGMKKTLVFHRGRAPKGIRTNWIMHEYRTTEHEFESGDQGGYVLYRLFKKPEEKSSTSSTDAMVTNGFCPSPTKSCPSDSHEADAMDETEIMLTHHSPMSDTWEKKKSSADYGQNQPVCINSWLASEAYSTSLLVEQEKKCSIMVSPDEASRVKEKDVLVHELDCEQIDSDVFPNVSRPLPPYADDYLIGNANQKLRTGSYPVNNANNAGGDALDAYLISALSSVDSCSGASVFPKDPSDGIFLKHTSWDSASYKDSGCSSDIDTESGLPPDAGLEAFDCPGRSLLPPDSIQMDNSVLYPEIKTQLSTLYENASLLPYDINGPDVYSVDSGAESLQELFSSLEELNNHRTSDNNNVFEGTGIKLRSRQVQQEQSNSELNQGNAARRICLQHSIGKAPLGAVQFESTSGDDNESKKSIDNGERELYCMAKSTSEINTMSNRDDPVEIGMSLRTQRLLHSPNGSFTRHDETSTNVSSPEEHQSHNELSIRNSSDGKSEPKAAGEHIGDKISVVGDSPPRAILDKVEGLSIHDSDDTPSSSNNCQMHRSVLRFVLRFRKNSANDNTLKDSPYSNATGCDSVVDYMFLFSCLLLSLLCVGIWRCINSGAL